MGVWYTEELGVYACNPEFTRPEVCDAPPAAYVGPFVHTC